MICALYIILSIEIFTSKFDSTYNDNTIIKLYEFKTKIKFTGDSVFGLYYYKGLKNKKLRNTLDSLMNEVTDYYIQYYKEKRKAKDYAELNKRLLGLFTSYGRHLKKKDRERICDYFIELLDIVDIVYGDYTFYNFINKTNYSLSESKFDCGP